MDGGLIAQWGATLVIAVGLILTALRNGSAQRARDTKQATEQAERDKKIAVEQTKRETKISEFLKHINEAIKHPDTGLAALKEDMNAIPDQLLLGNSWVRCED